MHLLMSEQIKYAVSDRVACITLNRPEARNALSPDVTAGLITLVRAADHDPDVKCVLIRGEGEHFSGGGDVKSFGETLSLTPDERYDMFERRLLVGNRLPQVLLDCTKPVVAATRGAVAGAGLAICLAADFVICASSSYFLAPHIFLGITLDCGLSSLLVGAMGIKAAKRLALLGDRVSAGEALDLGIVSQVIPDANLEEAVRSLTSRLAAGPAVAAANTKRLLNRAAYPGVVEQIAEESKAIAQCAATADFCEGVRATLARTKPAFD